MFPFDYFTLCFPSNLCKQFTQLYTFTIGCWFNSTKTLIPILEYSNSNAPLPSLLPHCNFFVIKIESFIFMTFKVW